MDKKPKKRTGPSLLTKIRLHFVVYCSFVTVVTLICQSVLCAISFILWEPLIFVTYDVIRVVMLVCVTLHIIVRDHVYTHKKFRNQEKCKKARKEEFQRQIAVLLLTTLVMLLPLLN